MELFTPRLALRPFREDDLAALFAIYGDAENRRYESEPLSLEETRLRLLLLLEDQQRMPQVSYPFALTLPAADEALGWVRLSLLNRAVRAYEIGWTVRRADWGKGYAAEAAREVLGFAFLRLNAHRVTAICHADNHASRRVAEKLGMHQEGLLRETRRLGGAWYDERVFALLEREFSYL